MDRLAEQVGHQRLGDAPAQRDPARRRVGTGPDHGRRVPRRARAASRRSTPAYDAARAAGHAVGLGLGLKNSGLGNGFLEIARAVVRFQRRRHASRCATAGPRWARASTPSPARWRSSELGVDPERIDVVVDTTRELGAGQTTGSRGTLMGAGSVAERLPGGAGRRLPARGRLRGRVPRRLDQQDRRRARAPRHPLGVRLRGPAGDHRPRDGRHRARWSPPTTSAGRSTRCCARARSRARCTWASGYALTEDFPSDDDGPAAPT